MRRGGGCLGIHRLRRTHLMSEGNNMNRFIAVVVVMFLCLAFGAGQNPSDQPAYKNSNLPLEQRVNDLVSRMTIEEKISQLGHTADAVPRLGIPEYNWWNEGLHGVARAGTATVFPQAIGLAAKIGRASCRGSEQLSL